MDHTDNPDKIEPTLATEQTDNSEANAPAEPIDRIDPAEPIDRIDPAEPIDRIDPADPMERIDPLDPMERIDPWLPADRASRPVRIRYFAACARRLTIPDRIFD